MKSYQKAKLSVLGAVIITSISIMGIPRVGLGATAVEYALMEALALNVSITSNGPCYVPGPKLIKYNPVTQTMVNYWGSKCTTASDTYCVNGYPTLNGGTCGKGIVAIKQGSGPITPLTSTQCQTAATSDNAGTKSTLLYPTASPCN